MSKSRNNAVTVAASKAGSVATRFASVEAEAQRIHTEQTGAKLVRAVLNGGGLHAVLSDGKTTIEVLDGKVALSVSE
jgi:hypothetical protein